MVIRCQLISNLNTVLHLILNKSNNEMHSLNLEQSNSMLYCQLLAHWIHFKCQTMIQWDYF